LPIEPGDGSDECVSTQAAHEFFVTAAARLRLAATSRRWQHAAKPGAETKPVAAGRSAAVTASQKSSIGHRKFLGAAGSATLALAGVA
jgi:hypothetical protein